jgi:hypothetical protein
MPPVRRGDLYRDRLLGFDVFLILDGVFFETLAISPREVIDVIEDGAVVIGASSMGALRASECWPAGMRGIGTIYRLFRRGLLHSDDEVAISFQPHRPYSPTTIPLINVRYAAARAVRDGSIERAAGQRLVAAAADLHFTERSWPTILRSAGIHDERLARSLSAHDLKGMDARRALRRLGRWMARAPEPRTGPTGAPPRSFLAAPRREGPLEAVLATPFPKESMWRWLVASGRYRRYAEMGHLNPDAELASRSEWIGRLEIADGDLAAAVDRRHAALALADDLTRQDSQHARAVWTEIALAGDAEALLLRFVTLESAVELARARGRKPTSRHRELARDAIARAHGFRGWDRLEATLGERKLRAWIEPLAEDLALASCMKEEFFEVPAGASGIERLVTWETG